MHIAHIGVVGAGVMGVGVALLFAQSGFPVTLMDHSVAQLQRARSELRHGVRQQMLLAQQDRDMLREAPERVTYTQDLATMKGVDIVIESVTEQWEIKRSVFEQLEAICPPDCIFTSNTSAIPITRLASVTHRPSQVLGTHFMNPAPLKPVVELIRGFHTTEATVQTVQETLTRAGRRTVVVNDAPGFVSNRVLMLTINEAIFLVHEGVSNASDVDEIFRTCFGHKMGPLETADLIGLDTILDSIEVLYESFKDSKYRPCPLLAQLVQAGLHGRKTGRGFFVYDTV
ncbi:MAG: 3-hydroxybutyryl-CoA dehydrogenase [Oscillochloris sp.]|nr:3-hydroxybutyryl-CoA dehydrogenase [Oscillochloris sp.]